jgi:hypothetical protein
MNTKQLFREDSIRLIDMTMTKITLTNTRFVFWLTDPGSAQCFETVARSFGEASSLRQC